MNDLARGAVDSANLMERLLYEVKRVVVGQDHFLERVLVAMLAHVSAHRLGFEFWGVRTSDLKATMARITYWAITGQKPVT